MRHRVCRFQDSIDTCEMVLHLNALHYPALSGKGLCHAALKQNLKAIESFKQALAINPQLKQVRERLRALESIEASGGDS
jgi:tetratricopeptide (TPR) repeat protein